MRRPGIADVLLLLCLASIWGGSFPAVKIAVAHLTDSQLVALRLIVGTLAVGAVALLMGRRIPADRHTWMLYGINAIVGNVAPFFLISHGQREIDAGLAAILMATMPLATIVLAHLLTHDEKLTARRLAGVLIGLAAILLLVGVDALKGLGGDVTGQLLMTGAAMCYALHVINSRWLKGTPPITNTACTIGLSASLVVPLMFATSGLPVQVPAEAAVAILFLGIGANGVAYLIFFRLVGSVGAGFTSMTNYMVPVIGVMWSALLLGERPSPRALLALGLIFVGIAVAHLNLKRAA